jgi:hypothetical protein
MADTMSDDVPQPEPDPDLAAIAQALIRAEAQAAVAPLGFLYPDLLAPYIAQSLRCDRSSMTVYAVDEKGERRYGVTADMLARQWIADFNARKR